MHAQLVRAELCESAEKVAGTDQYQVVGGGLSEVTCPSVPAMWQLSVVFVVDVVDVRYPVDQLDTRVVAVTAADEVLAWSQAVVTAEDVTDGGRPLTVAVPLLIPIEELGPLEVLVVLDGVVAVRLPLLVS